MHILLGGIALLLDRKEVVVSIAISALLLWVQSTVGTL